MYNDAIDLWDFYGTRLGQVARRTLRRQVRAVWPSLGGQTVLGLGYATPYLRQFRREAARVFAIMPAPQGVLNWPPNQPGLVALAEETALPLQDVCVDRVLLAHAVECSEQLRAMLDEVWRVLAGNGRLLVMVPNRRGLWARNDRTPFGHGHPYSPSQLSRLLRSSMFTPTRTVSALFMPPYDSRLMIRSAAAFETAGEKWFRGFAGVIMVEAVKQIYASRPQARRAAARAPGLIPLPAGRVTAATGRALQSPGTATNAVRLRPGRLEPAGPGRPRPVAAVAAKAG